MKRPEGWVPAEEQISWAGWTDCTVTVAGGEPVCAGQIEEVCVGGMMAHKDIPFCYFFLGKGRRKVI